MPAWLRQTIQRGDEDQMAHVHDGRRTAETQDAQPVSAGRRVRDGQPFAQMPRTLLIGVCLAAVLGTSACAGETGERAQGEAVGSNRPSETATPQAKESVDPDLAARIAEIQAGVKTPVPIETDIPTASNVLKFGQTFTYTDDLSVIVSQPRPFNPSESAARDEAPAYVVLDVTIVNGTGAVFDPSMVVVTVQSANVEGSTVFDSAQRIEGSPSTSLLPGRETKFAVAYGVTDPNDLVVEVTPGYEYNSAIFTS